MLHRENTISSKEDPLSDKIWGRIFFIDSFSTEIFFKN